MRRVLSIEKIRECHGDPGSHTAPQHKKKQKKSMFLCFMELRTWFCFQFFQEGYFHFSNLQFCP